MGDFRGGGGDTRFQLITCLKGQCQMVPSLAAAFSVHTLSLCNLHPILQPFQYTHRLFATYAQFFSLFSTHIVSLQPTPNSSAFSVHTSSLCNLHAATAATPSSLAALPLLSAILIGSACLIGHLSCALLVNALYASAFAPLCKCD
jgi:hypothetical protein